jgi:RNA ligase
MSRHKTTDPDFRPWPSIPRWNTNVTITEKIDGANGCIVITELPLRPDLGLGGKVYQMAPVSCLATVYLTESDQMFAVRAQSRNRFVTTGGDLMGFGDWVEANAVALVATLGVGYHFGEWWGNGIQRNYGLPQGDKRFSLFNTSRWTPDLFEDDIASVPGLGVVPVLGRTTAIYVNDLLGHVVRNLHELGSAAVPGYANPEGVVIYHGAANQTFKYTIGGDKHKGSQ